MIDLYQDLRFSIRQMRQSPGFTLALVLCLALGIGANSATFSFANALLRDRPGVSEPDRLVRLLIRWTNGPEFGSLSYPDYVDLRDHVRAFEGLAVGALRPLHLSGDGRNDRLWSLVVSGNYFRVLGTEIRLGRDFLAEEDRTPGTHPVAILSHGLWSRRFAGDPQIIGRKVLINGRPFTIVGVAPRSFRGANAGLDVDLWVPIMMQEALVPGPNLLESRGNNWLSFNVGRLRPGATIAQAQAECDAIMDQLIAAYPGENVGKNVVLYPESKSSLHPMVRSSFVGFLGLMFGVVGLILLLACFNVAGLLLARSVSRSREIAIRLALGAGRRRLIRQLFTESVVLALVAGGVGLLVGVWLTRVLRSVRPPDIPIDIAPELNVAVLGFTFVAALLTAIICGLVPALRTTRPELVSALKEGAGVSGDGRSFLRRALVVAQVALAMVLLIGATMVLRSLENARQVDLGFEVEEQLIATVDVGLQGYDEEAGRNFFRILQERVGQLPGVEAVGYAEVVPMRLMNQQTGAVPAGYEIPDGTNPPAIDYNRVSTGYFAAMGVPILRGRGFEPTDDADGRRVVIINQTMARRFWPDADPVGSTVNIYGEDHQVVGLVKDGKYFTLGEDPKPYMYLPTERYYTSGLTLHVRTSHPSSLLEAVRREVEALDASLPVTELEPMTAHLDFVLLPARLAAAVVSVFALLALVLAAVGLYAIIAFWVNQGVREIAIRMALGARIGEVVGMVVEKGMLLTGIGLGGGLIAGFLLSLLSAHLLYGLQGTELTTYLIAAAILGIVALFASYLPAQKAARVEPMAALRAE